ncbi:MAG: recombination protein RecR [Candidatus Hydrothermota bacterium]|uniref:Recombination protein RecR n=1 Tax=candidate division WOR-3 bacterium TaxID=2052148 RepID=A0A7C1BJJ0_UNCW3|nr:MAG: recombination protein RecR [Candidatus Hydrothermae bacterium]HDM90553.1 recombination protein RecR [candidate division WOR-3 bacterium]
MWVPSSLLNLLEALKKLPGVGQRSAERIAFYLLRERSQLEELRKALEEARENLTFCSICHVITDEDPCPICRDPKRDSSLLCVVERPQDVFLLEKMGFFHGKYHVLGGVISPLDNVAPEDLFISDLLERIERDGIKEVILALSPTVEGDTTAYYIADLLKPKGIKVTRIARGLPTGSDLSLSDVTTLKEALLGRREL